MARHIVIVERPEAWRELMPEIELVLPKEYLAGGEQYSGRGARVINLCRRFSYLSRGYYCSLLAEARGQRALPSARTVLELNRDILPMLDMDALEERAGRALAQSTGNRVELRIFFGTTGSADLEDLARRIFESFPCPLLDVELERERDSSWRLGSVRAGDVERLDEAERRLLAASLVRHLAKPRRDPRATTTTRYDIAILYDPDEALPPSDEKALERFRDEGRKLGLGVELITKRDLGRIAEFDALFIRTTTRIGHYSFRFAKRAETEGLAVIDDPDSILRCTNKLYLAELLRSRNIPAPRTVLVPPESLKSAAVEVGLPVVLKIPDGSFSLGVYKAGDMDALEQLRREVFGGAELVLMQEYVYTPFDWRIGLLDGRPLFACQYFMSKRNWKVVNHEGSRIEEGRWKTLALDAVPRAVLDAATRAGAAIGDGLYGVDVKELPDRVMVIEVNDNPNLEAGVEDKVLGRELYRTILQSFVARIERRRAGVPRAATADR
ncbi:MAG TPA: RimK family protein [Gammaproteobacteria bacterium]